MADPQYSQQLLNIDAKLQSIYDECVCEVIGRHSVDANNAFSPAIRDDLYLLHQRVLTKQATEDDNARYRPLYLEISTAYTHKLRQLSTVDPALAQYLQYQQLQATQQMAQRSQQVQQVHQPPVQQQTQQQVQQQRNASDRLSQTSYMLEFAYQTQGQHTKDILRTLRAYYDSYAQQSHMPQVVESVFAQMKLIFCYLFCMIKLSGDSTKAAEIEQAYSLLCQEKVERELPFSHRQNCIRS